MLYYTQHVLLYKLRGRLAQHYKYHLFITFTTTCFGRLIVVQIHKKKSILGKGFPISDTKYDTFVAWLLFQIV